MIALIEQHVKQGRYEQALTLLPMLEKTFFNHAEMMWVIKSLQQDLERRNKRTLTTVQQLKSLLIG